MNILKTEIPMFLFKNEHYIIKISYRMYVYTIIHPIIYHTIYRYIYHIYLPYYIFKLLVQIQCNQ